MKSGRELHKFVGYLVRPFQFLPARIRWLVMLPFAMMGIANVYHFIYLLLYYVLDYYGICDTYICYPSIYKLWFGL